MIIRDYENYFGAKLEIYKEQRFFIYYTNLFIKFTLFYNKNTKKYEKLKNYFRSLICCYYAI